jgi:hypothetical protein
VVPPPLTGGDGFLPLHQRQRHHLFCIRRQHPPFYTRRRRPPPPTPSGNDNFLPHISDNNIVFRHLPVTSSLLHMATTSFPLQLVAAVTFFPTSVVATSSFPYQVVTSPLLHMASMTLSLHPTMVFPLDVAPPCATNEPPLDGR